MRYVIVKGKPISSIWIDAPYDCLKDALEAIKEGVYHYTLSMDSPIYKKVSETESEAV